MELHSCSEKLFKKKGPLEAGGKYPDARHPKSRGMRRTQKYAVVTRDEDNAADGCFPPAPQVSIGYSSFICNKKLLEKREMGIKYFRDATPDTQGRAILHGFQEFQ